VRVPSPLYMLHTYTYSWIQFSMYVTSMYTSMCTCGIAVDVEWVDRQSTCLCPVAPLYVTHIYILMNSDLHVYHIYVYIHEYLWCCRPPKIHVRVPSPFHTLHTHTYEFKCSCVLDPRMNVAMPRDITLLDRTRM